MLNSPPSERALDERDILPGEAGELACLLRAENAYLAEVVGKVVDEQSSYSPKFGFIRRVIFEMHFEFRGKSNTSQTKIIVWARDCARPNMIILG